MSGVVIIAEIADVAGKQQHVARHLQGVGIQIPPVGFAFVCHDSAQSKQVWLLLSLSSTFDRRQKSVVGKLQMQVGCVLNLHIVHASINNSSSWSNSPLTNASS